MEALRLLSSAAPAAPLAGLAAEHTVLPDVSTAPLPLLGDPAAVSSAAWDAALFETHLPDLLSGSGGPSITRAVEPAEPARDHAALASGLAQLNKYLSRSWYRAAIPPQSHEDSSQAVYATLLQQLGRTRFDSLVGEVGRAGIKDVFSRETDDGVLFFRAVDMVKKRAQRERSFQSLDNMEAPAAEDSSAKMALREALREAIDHHLSPREASLINDTLMGKTPAEIALHWGVAPKTISNEKTRVIQKLRDVLLAHSAD